MPRVNQKHQHKQILEPSEDKLNELASWIGLEIDDALSSRKPIEAVWRSCLQMYDGVPKLQARDVPVENAPNIEVTIGAIAVDQINAQAIDLLFNTTPFATCRPKPKSANDKDLVQTAKDVQTLVNHLALSRDVGLREALENTVMDDIQLGTGFLYIPYVEKTKKTTTAKVLSYGPCVRSIAPEDLIVPGGSRGDFDAMTLVGVRFTYTSQELMDLKRANPTWDIEGVQPCGAQGWVRSRRELLSRHTEGVLRKGDLYDLIDVYCYFDIDGDGFDEDLHCVYNHTGQKLVSYSYNAMDRRPIERMIYQRRAHVFYGIGVLEMMSPFEEELTNVHNYGTLNILLANSRVWVGTAALPDTLPIWPGRYVQATSKDDLTALQMADVYSSIWQEQNVIMQLANQRVGLNNISSPQNIPGRTPGITMMSALQQVNRRFTPAFDSIRICAAQALTQCLYRIQERLLSGDNKVTAMIFQILGYEAGTRVINILQNENFDEHLDIELIASSAYANREADRQDSMMLTNILAQYYQRTLELVTIAANPQTPPEVRAIANKIAGAASEVIDRTIRTFDSVRDPASFIIDVENELNQLEVTNGSEQQALQQLMMTLVDQGGGQKPLPPAASQMA